jgi:hypothetical protein
MRPETPDVCSTERHCSFRQAALAIPCAKDRFAVRRETLVHSSIFQKDVDPVKVSVDHSTLACLELRRDENWSHCFVRPNVRHERRAKGREAAFGTSARWRG